MKHLLTVVFVLSGLYLSAQEKHFIFIQSDNSMPFYVQMNGKLYSSSATGYVILPKLLQGQYNLTVGFAQNAFPEQNFQCTIENKDLGFNLKNFGEKGWGLFNLQSFEVSMATSTNAANSTKMPETQATQEEDEEPVISFNKPPKQPVVENNEPARVAGNGAKVPLTTGGIFKVAVADKTVRTDGEGLAAGPVADYMAKEPLATAGVFKVQITDKTMRKGGVKDAPPELVADNTVKEPLTTPAVFEAEIVNHTIVMDAPAKTLKTDTIKAEVTKVNDVIPEVKKVAEVKNHDSLTMSFVDTKGTDTIQVTIPSSPAVQQKTDTVTAVVAVPASPVVTGNTPKETVVSVPDKPMVPAITNPACRAMSSEEDYYKLRKKMLNQMSDESMIGEARKAYQGKCFTTSQVKALSVLFMSDEGRYRFFDASYNFVSDPGMFPSLQSQLIDPYYINRFKAMLR